MLSSLSFLTCLGGARQPNRTSVAWFPAVGALIGLLLAGVWWVASEVWTRPIAALLVVAADLIVTGMLHFDGLADAADGLLPPVSVERRLQIMRDPGTGAFAVVVVAMILGLRWIALTRDRHVWLLLIGVWTISRTVMAVIPKVVPYARPEGLATAFAPGEDGLTWPTAVAALVGVVGGIAALVAWRLGPGLAVLAAELIGGAAVVGLAWKRIGGFTGDVLGAAGVVAETMALLVAAAKW